MNSLVDESDSQAGSRRPAASRTASAGVIPFATPGDLDAAGIGPAAVLAELRDSVSAIGALGLCRDDLEGALGALSQLRAAIDACEARLAAEIGRLGDFGDDAADVLRNRSGCSRAVAKRVAGRAQALADMPNVVEALSEGRMTRPSTPTYSSALRASRALTQSIPARSCSLPLRGAGSSALGVLLTSGSVSTVWA